MRSWLWWQDGQDRFYIPVLWLLVPQQPCRTGRCRRDGLSWAQRRPCGFVTLSPGAARGGTAASPGAGRPALGLCRSTSAAPEGRGLVAAGDSGRRGVTGFGVLEAPPLGSCSAGSLWNVTVSLFKHLAPWSR